MSKYLSRVALVSLSITLLACGADDATEVSDESGTTRDESSTEPSAPDTTATGDESTTGDASTTGSTDATTGDETTTADASTETTTTAQTSHPDESSSGDPPVVCGDGIQEGDEECDDGDANADDAACLLSCEMATCGDGFVQAGVETCDDGAANDDEGACLEACVSASCGDGFVQAGVEGCDDGNADEADGCFSDCTPDPCGPQGAILRVDADAAGANDGSSWANAYSSLHAALQAAGVNDQIWIAQGRYTAVVANAPVAILQDCVDVIGGFAGTEDSLDDRPVVPLPTVLDGDFADDDDGDGFADNAFQVVTANDVDNVLLDGLIISGGRALAGGDASNGGGLHAVASTLALRDVSFVGNVAGVRGGGAYADDSVLDLVDVTFADNAAGESGGGLFQQFAAVSIVDCTFISNATVDDDDLSTGGGLAISSADFAITGSTFTDNTSSYYGGAVSVAHDDDYVAVISGTVFEGNDAADSGGAIFAASTLEITDSEFSNNTARDGGAIFSNDAPISLAGVVFDANVADPGGGGAVLAQTDGSGTHPLVVTDSTFTGNVSNGYYAYGGGGALHVLDHTLTILDSTFTGNSAGGYGGAVFLDRTAFTDVAIELADSVFEGNVSTSSSGGAISLDFYSVGPAERLVFTGNTAAVVGGAIDGGTSAVELVDSEFYTNSAGLAGGALSGGPNIDNGWFESNSSAVGGACSAASEVRNSVFLANTATDAAGAVSSGDAFINCAFLDNAVTGPTGSGGAVALETPQEVFFDSCVFEGNTAPTNGGAIYATETRLVVRNSAFRDNAAGDSGGAIQADRYWDHPIIASSTFYENTAPSTGGIVVADGVAGTGTVVNVVAWGNGTDFTGTGNVTATHVCSEGFVSLGDGNLFGIADPIVVGPQGELLLDQGSPCVDAGDDMSADATYDALGLDWGQMTTDPAASADVGTVDMGVHYPLP